MSLRSLVMTAVLLGGVGVAQAADLPQRAPAPAPAVVVAVPVYNWTGFYIGANGGYGWAGVSASSGGLTVDGGDLKGPFAGGQVGYNFQSGVFVFGVEFDGQWANIKESLRRVRPDLHRHDQLLLHRPRPPWRRGTKLPVLWDRRLRASRRVKSEVTDGTTTVSVSGDRGGWTAGGGVEAGFGNVSVKLEYLYMQTFDKDETVFGVPVTWNVHVHTVKLGLNYRFGGGPVVARY